MPPLPRTHFVSGLAVWDALNETQQDKLRSVLLSPSEVPSRAAEGYAESYRRLAIDCAEFSMWMSMTDSAASRAAIERVGEAMETGLARLQSVLEGLRSGKASAEWPARLALAYRPQLDRPIAETAPDEALAGLVVPTLGAGYVSPRFRVAEYSPEARPAEESWWNDAVHRDDVEWFLAGHLTSPTAVEVPLVLLGQPGSGKSLLTKVLAARLPPEDYLPVRVELRHVNADAPLQDQIESALREATGERMEWPDLVREAGDALPVVMLDGFDELLQSTGVSHSNFLELVREFQRREADQGRPVAVIVTSRTVVADRVRFPEGTVVAKMEPFDDSQIARWLAVWNEANAGYFSSSQPDLRPLPIEVVLPHRALAEQPLLLLMLSFYDADGNALQKHSDQLARADLYEGMLAKFIDRELDKLHADAEQSERDDLAAKELDELSVVAFAMFNRGKKSVSEPDLDGDLATLLPEDYSVDDAAARMARRLSRAQMAVGRFFFIHRSQAIVDDARLNDYEFLHATFGEYLVARLVSKILDDLVELSQAEPPSRAVRSGSGPQDDRLWDLLSFAPMADGSQILGFLGELINKPDARIVVLRAVLAELFRRTLLPRQLGYAGYEPRRLTVPSRHAAYSANLLLLNILASGDSLRGSALFGTEIGVVDTWRSFALLWRSQLEPAGWDGLINAVSVSRGSDSAARDLTISYGKVRLTKPIEHFATVGWLSAGAVRSGEESQIEDTGINAEKTAWQAIFLCAPELDLLMNALQPLLRLSPAAFRQVTHSSDGTVRSVMHEALRAIIEAGISDNRENSLKAARALLRRRSVTSTVANKWATVAGTLATSVLSSPLTLATLGMGGVVAPIVTSTGTFSDSFDQAESEETFPALRLLTADYDATVKSFHMFRDLTDVSAVYENVNPIELAAEEPSFIDSVLRLAQEKDLIDWAAVPGLTLLAAMEPGKLGELTELRVKFVLQAAGRYPAHANVIRLIRDRYNTHVRGRQSDCRESAEEAPPKGQADSEPSPL